MATQRTYVVPLRKEFLKVPYYKRSQKAMKALKEFLVKHLKTDNVLIGPKLNNEVWKDGIKAPPHKVKVSVVLEKDEAKVELFGHEYPKSIEQATKAPQGMKEKLAAAVSDVKGDKKSEEKADAPKTKEDAKEDKPEAQKKAPAKKAEPKTEAKAQEKPKAKEKAEK